MKPGFDASPLQPPAGDSPSPARRRLLGGAAALSAVALAGCAFPAGGGLVRPPAPVPHFRIGDLWRYERINRYNGASEGQTVMTVRAVTPELRIAVGGAGVGPQGSEEIYATPWQVIQEPAYDLVQVFDPPQPLLPSTLQAGASQRYRGRYRLVDGQDWYYWSVWLDAVRWEEVEVPAGRFEALRVDRRIAFTHSDLWRVQSERSESLWYAPQVNRWVQRVWTGNYRRFGLPRYSGMREDWVTSRLLEYAPAAA